MLVVKLEIWPFGNSAAAREIGRLEIANTGGPEEACSYELRAHGEASTGKLRRRGMTLHDRSKGAWRLVELALKALRRGT